MLLDCVSRAGESVRAFCRRPLIPFVEITDKQCRIPNIVSIAKNNRPALTSPFVAPNRIYKNELPTVPTGCGAGFESA
jgi:hypothetical protein